MDTQRSDSDRTPQNAWGLSLFDATHRGDWAEAEHGDVADQSHFDKERLERPFECARSD